MALILSGLDATEEARALRAETAITCDEIVAIHGEYDAELGRDAGKLS